ncbi:MAG: spermidine synthase [Alteromonadaceae bacterium]|jgi:spermidine synthase
MKNVAKQVNDSNIAPLNKNIFGISDNVEKLFSIGYLSYLPYRAHNLKEFVTFSTHHTCPCCKKVLPVQSEIDNISLFETCKANLYSISRQCSCGFDVPFHIIVSNLPSTSLTKILNNKKNALDSSDKIKFMDSNNLETINLHCRYLLHLALFDEAIIFIEKSTNDHPSHALLPFYKAFALDKKGHHKRALHYYDNCLDLDPECGEAWHNKALILGNLKRQEEASYNLVRYSRLDMGAEQINKASLRKSLQASKVLFSTEGVFGEIRVMQNSTVRLLTINNEVEGSFWLKNNKPSNIPAGDYVAGFLLAGCYTMADTTPVNGLMLGLGAGAGVIALLENFNQLHLTVIEIDPNIISTAIGYFPLLKHFMQTGRLTIICQDAIYYIATISMKFDFILIDLYQGNLSYSSPFREKEFLRNIASSAKLVGINLIQPQSWQQLQQVIDDFNQAGISLKSCFPTGVRGNNKLPYQNRVLFSEVVDNAVNFIPYQHIDANYLHQCFRRDFMHMLLRCENLTEYENIQSIPHY